MIFLTVDRIAKCHTIFDRSQIWKYDLRSATIPPNLPYSIDRSIWDRGSDHHYGRANWGLTSQWNQNPIKALWSVFISAVYTECLHIQINFWFSDLDSYCTWYIPIWLFKNLSRIQLTLVLIHYKVWYRQLKCMDLNDPRVQD